MAEIGIRELKAKASEIIRQVREENARYTVTYRGRAVGVLLPLESSSLEEAGLLENSSSVWDDLIKLGQKIGDGWESDKSSVELLTEMRR